MVYPSLPLVYIGIRYIKHGLLGLERDAPYIYDKSRYPPK